MVLRSTDPCKKDILSLPDRFNQSTATHKRRQGMSFAYILIIRTIFIPMGD